MTLAELRALCERSRPGEVDSTIQLIIAARTWLPALIEVAEAAQRRKNADKAHHRWRERAAAAAALDDALARLDEVGK